MPSKKDQELIAAATEAISQRYRNNWQEVGAAMRTRDGRIVTGVNIDAYIGRIAVCAEAIAIGRAITETGDHGIETIVAVRHPKPGEPGKIAVISLIVVAFGAALLQMFLAVLELDALRTMVSVAVGLLAFVTALAAFLPSVVAGLIFALAAVYGGINMIWMAWLAAA